MTTEHKPHSRDEIIEEARALIAYIDHGTFGNCPTVDSTEIVRDYINLYEQHEEMTLAADHHRMFWQKAEGRERGLKEQFDSLLSLAEHLFQMIDRETWRATGGDDQQGHYEGDYHAEQIEQRLRALRASFPATESSQTRRQ